MATGTLQDLLNSGMTREEINALLAQSNVSTAGFDPLGTTGRGDPYMPPPDPQGRPGMVEQAPLNTIRNNRTGAVTPLTDMYGQPSQSQPSGPITDPTRGYVDTPAGRGMYMKADPTRVVLGDGRIVGLGRDTGAERARMKENLALDKVRADIAHTEAATRQAGIRPSTTPAGYRATATGNLEAIPGGPADQKIAGQYSADVAQLQSSQSDLDRLAASANELLKTSNLGRITGIVGALPNIPGMEGADAQAKLNTLKSQVGFGVLQAMRNASKTGGALGNVSDAEGKRLEANLAALENAQSEKQMRESLQKIVDFSAQAKDRLAGAFNMRHNPDNPSTPEGSKGAPSAAAAPRQYSGAEIQAVAMRTGKTEAQVRADMKAKGLL